MTTGFSSMHSLKLWTVGVLIAGLVGCGDDRPAMIQLDGGLDTKTPAEVTELTADKTQPADAPDVKIQDNKETPDVTKPDDQVPIDVGQDADLQDAVDATDTKLPDLPKTETPVYDIPVVDLPELDVPIPDVPVPDVPKPDVQIPDIQEPDIQIPDVFVPDIQEPDIQIPDVFVPDIQEPDIQEPDLPIEPDLVDVVEPEIIPEPDIEPEPDLVDLFELPPDIAEDLAPEAEPEPDCQGFDDPEPDPPVGTMLTQADFSLIGKAQIDGKFMTKGGQEVDKINQAYVWALARDDERVWVGTVANTLCLMFSGFDSMKLTYETSNCACDKLAPDTPLGFPDWRLPEIWEFNTDNEQWTRRTEPEGTEENPGISHDTLGWRAAYTLGEYTFVAGPGTGFLWNMEGYGTSVVIFKNGEYVGSKKLEENNDARKFTYYGGNLYFGSFKTDGSGVILKWEGDESNLPDSLFQFAEVGHFDGSAAWIVGYKERLYAVSWNTMLVGGGDGFDVWRSPKIPPCGLTEEHYTQWEKVFDYTDYDPDLATSGLAAGGAMIVFKGAIYFGSMHIPFSYKCSDPENMVLCSMEKYQHTEAISIFRLEESLDGDVVVECLYGEDKGGIYQPLLGPPGFGNHYNNYTWSMTIHDGWLYVGTMDYSYFMSDALAGYGLPPAFPGLKPYQQHGFDLWATSNGIQWSQITIDGLGNQTNWGARQMLSDGETLWLGTGNPFNLNAQGGWELWGGKK